MSTSHVVGRRDAANKLDDFRGTLRVHAAEVSKTVTSLLISILDGSITINTDHSKDVILTRDEFGQKMNSIRSIRQKFSPKDVMDVYDEAAYELGASKLTASVLIEFLSNTISKTRSMGMKLRASITQDYNGLLEYKNAFKSFAGDDHGSYADLNSFADFAEDMLDLSEGTISDADAAALYAFVDKDGDGRVSLNDFLEFVVGQSIEAIKGLESGSDSNIIDIVSSNTPDVDAELKRLGYMQILPDTASMGGVDPMTHGSFGKGQSLWTWRQKQGSASGRLKAIVDIQLDTAATSSALVLSGYTRLTAQISGQSVWIKRATSDEEEKDAIVDFRISVGNTKNAGDKIWSSPGVGWNRVDGNFQRSTFNLSSNGAFLWYKAMRNRAKSTSQLSSILRGATSLSGHNRGASLMNAVQTALRHFVPHSAMGSMKGGQASKDDGDGESKRDSHGDRSFDFTHLYTMYNGEKSTLSSSNFRRILYDAGIRLDSADEGLCWRCWNSDQTGYLKRKDFSRVLVFNDNDLDIVIDKIRGKLLEDRAVMAVGKDGQTRNTLRVSRILSHIFKHINRNGDNVMALDEFMSMASKLGCFLLPEEAQRIMRIMDLNGDGRVEDDDFIRFLRSQSESRSRRAARVFEYSQSLKQWLRQGQTDPTSPGITSQWAILKKRRVWSSGMAFHDYLGPEDLLQLLAHQEINISFSESCELAMLVAPSQQGRIQNGDLAAFMTNHSRTIGELVAMLERDIMKDVVDVYRAHRAAMRTDGVFDTELSERFAAAVSNVVGRVSASTNVESNTKRSPQQADNISSAEGAAQVDVVSVAQLKAGIEAAMGRPPTHGALPNLEEWAILAVLVGAGRYEDDVYGVHAKEFIEGVCAHVAGAMSHFADGETANLDVLCSELRMMIKDEAKTASKGRGFDYVSVFSSFDLDGGGTITVDEFLVMLKKLQLLDRLPERYVPALLKVFDRNNTGHVTFDDFLYFVESGAKMDDDIAIEDEDEDEDLGLSSNVPPAKITNNPDCDWLLWFLYRQACRIGRRDPETVVSEMETKLRSVDNTTADMGISSKKLWNVLMEMKLTKNMRKAQFDAGMYFLAMEGDGSRDEDSVDYVSLCKYISRMGFAYNALIQERRTVDVKKFGHLMATLKKALLHLDGSNTSSVDMPSGSSTPSVLIGSHFERILRRQDSNQDGLLTVPEFSQALGRMGDLNHRLWTKAMIRKLFEECGNRSDGLLNIMDFGKMVRGDYSNNIGGGYGGESTMDGLSDDDDDNVFSLQKTTSDAALFKKVSDVMMDLVPMSRRADSSPNSLTSHVEAVRSTVYKYFHRFDPSGRGLVSEEHFSKFAQKSGLKNRLRAAELRKLTSKLRRKVDDNYSGSQVDYDKLCRMLSPPSDSLPRSRIDAVMHSLQHAAKDSAMNGRSFVTLCTLADPRLTGKISSEEFCIVCKMMGCPLSMSELEMFKEALTETMGSKYRGHGDMIDYNQAGKLLAVYEPGAQLSHSAFDYTPDTRFHSQHRDGNGSLPTYATPGSVTRMPFSPGATTGPSLDTQRSVRTLGGRYVTTPMYHDRGFSATTPVSSSRGRGVMTLEKGTGSVEERALVTLAGRISNSRYALRLNQPVMVALLRHCEDKDRHHSGYLSEAELQDVFNECDIVLTPPDLRAIRVRFCRSVVDDSVDYHSLCSTLKEIVAGSESTVDSHTSTFLQSPAATRKLATFRADGVNVRKAFEDSDYDKTGTVSSQRFAEMIRRFGLLQSERQLAVAMEEHASISDRNKINYEDFCDALDTAERVRGSRHALGFGSAAKSGIVDAGGYDGVRSSRDRLRSSRDGHTTTDVAGRPPFGAPVHVGRNTYSYGSANNINSGAGDQTWACHLCSSQNPMDAAKCHVCDAAQGVPGAGAQGSLQCLNCRFMNSPVAQNCHMCHGRL
jgi:Ca2+-binding EF-hand superfamily protein